MDRPSSTALELFRTQCQGPFLDNAIRGFLRALNGDDTRCDLVRLVGEGFMENDYMKYSSTSLIRHVQLPMRAAILGIQLLTSCQMLCDQGDPGCPDRSWVNMPVEYHP